MALSWDWLQRQTGSVLLLFSLGVATLACARETRPDDRGAGAAGAGGDSGGTVGASTGAGGGAGHGGGGAAGGSGGAPPGDSVGEFVLTYYWFLFEEDYAGPADTELPDIDCKPVVEVRKGFADDVCLEGSGATVAGPGVNLEGECACGYLCPAEDKRVCFFAYDLEIAPWGMGSTENALEPLRSIAMNVGTLRGKAIYLAPFDGLEVPEARGVGGLVHDGCFRVDDESYSFGSEGLDVFLGPKALLAAFEDVRNSTLTIDARAGGERCAYLER